MSVKKAVAATILAAFISACIVGFVLIIGIKAFVVIVALAICFIGLILTLSWSLETLFK